MKKQDLNGVRTPEDVERRHNLGAIPGLEKDVSELQDEMIIDSQLSSSSAHAVENKVITANIVALSNNKVDKVPGKGLSTNDFTDYYLNLQHSHSNKNALDSISQQDITNWNNSTTNHMVMYENSSGTTGNVEFDSGVPNTFNLLEVLFEDDDRNSYSARFQYPLSSFGEITLVSEKCSSNYEKYIAKYSMPSNYELIFSSCSKVLISNNSVTYSQSVTNILKIKKVIAYVI